MAFRQDAGVGGWNAEVAGMGILVAEVRVKDKPRNGAKAAAASSEMPRRPLPGGRDKSQHKAYNIVQRRCLCFTKV